MRGVGAGELPPGSIGLISNPIKIPQASAQHAARIKTAMMMAMRLAGRGASAAGCGS